MYNYEPKNHFPTSERHWKLQSRYRLDLEDFLIFYHIVDQGSVVRASQVLGMFQSRASRSLSRVERAFKGHVLHKDMRAITLTRLGHIAYDTARNVIFEMEEAYKRMDHRRNTMEGSISLVCNSAFGFHPN